MVDYKLSATFGGTMCIHSCKGTFDRSYRSHRSPAWHHQRSSRRALIKFVKISPARSSSYTLTARASEA